MTVTGDYVTAAVLAVIAVAMFGLAVAAIAPEEEPPEEVDLGPVEWGTVWQMDGLKEASGSVSIVYLDGVRYARAAELGDGRFIAGHYAYSCTVVKCTVDVIMTMGQSNAAYYKPVSAEEADPTPQPGTAFYWGTSNSMPNDTSNSVEACGIYDFIGPSGCRVGDKGPAECATYYDLTGHKVLWLSLGVPGKKIISWTPGHNAWELDMIWLASMMPLVQEYFNVDHVWMTWAQGESDAKYATPEADYIATFEDLHERVADGAYGLVPDAWFLVSGRTAVMNRNGVDINGALAELPDLIPDVFLAVQADIPDSFTQANGELNTDNLHYTQKGDNVIAVALATYIAEWMASEGI